MVSTSIRSSLHRSVIRIWLGSIRGRRPVPAQRYVLRSFPAGHPGVWLCGASGPPNPANGGRRATHGASSGRGRVTSLATAAAEDEFFVAEQNGRLVKNAEAYYRSMFRGRVASWNLRDRHMADTLEALTRHLGTAASPGIVVWAHNSHLGDARATEMGQHGELNVGQLVRECRGTEAILIGFTTDRRDGHGGHRVGWPCGVKRVKPSLPDSVEHVFTTQTSRSPSWIRRIERRSPRSRSLASTAR